ncbi:MAG: hypothetical protein LBS03_06655 [Bacteroidales bacterium]|jgi:hypothetical protein|nr:hypothetical protein [Bacteroidales bacterium]
MKKFVFTVILAVAVMSAHAQVKAVFGAISSNASLYTEGFNDVSIKVVTVTSDQFSLVSKLDKVKDYVYNELSKELPFTLVPESSVLGNEAFQAYAKEDNGKVNAINTAVKVVSAGSGVTRIGSDGYLLRQGFAKKETATIINFFTEEQANALLQIDMDFYLSPNILVMGNGSAAARVRIFIKLIDKNGKLLMHVWANGKSVQDFGIAGGQIVKNRGNIPIALNEAMDNVFVDMQESLPKAIKKFEKKLVKYKYK